MTTRQIYSRLNQGYIVVHRSKWPWSAVYYKEVLIDGKRTRYENRLGDGSYELGIKPPNFPMPAICEVCLWDYSLWIMLYNTPPLSDEEWEREEEEWQDFLDNHN